MLRYFFLLFALGCVLVLSLAGVRDSRWLPQKMTHPPIEIFPDMDHQPKYLPQHTSTFFADGRAARNHIPGTIPLGYNLPHEYYQTAANNRSDDAGFTDQPDYYNTGKMGNVYGDGFPKGVKVDDALMARGKERFEINCAICHGKTAAGDGIIKSYGLATVANLQDPRIQTMPDGQIFSTITNGKNTMGAYGPQVAVEDRWAIIAYLRALQQSQNTKLADLTEAQKQELNSKQ